MTTVRDAMLREYKLHLSTAFDSLLTCWYSEYRAERLSRRSRLCVHASEPTDMFHSAIHVWKSTSAGHAAEQYIL
jgi:hypothetical protein